ncbi:unnamed protein product, partial [marine sediment metagenome]
LAEKNLYQRLVHNEHSVWSRIVGRIPVLRRLLWRIRDEAGKIAIQMLKEVEIPDPEIAYWHVPIVSDRSNN